MDVTQNRPSTKTGPEPTTSTWVQDLAATLGQPRGDGLAHAFAARTPASYRDQTTPDQAALDLAELEQLAAGIAGAEPPGPTVPAFGGRHRLTVRPSTDGPGTFRIRRYGEKGIELTHFLPILESFGLVAVEAVPHLIAPGSKGEPAVHIDDIGLRIDSAQSPEALRFVWDVHGPRLVSALDAVARGEGEVDSLNHLVTVAGLDWRQVTVLRAYLQYCLQVDGNLTAAELSDALIAFPDAARALIGYFYMRFDPEVTERRSAGMTERARCVAALDLVPQLQQDRVLRRYLGLIDATLRTNYFRRDAAGGHPPVVSLKLDSTKVPDLPAPRPYVEIFLHGSAVEGIHIRAGAVARGGLRWSERPSDFRTEVLDLALAQMKKNAIIVPTGSKGGFVCRAGSRGPRWAPNADEVRDAYEIFVRALLDVTDNLVGGAVLTPVNVIAHDGADPYLVVAPDKGTASFSDLANSISEEYGFWLGDAFASGGSHGYDHKAMGITAKGAWVAVRRHFHQLGIDVQSDPVKVAGVGDMSGDVFGNGMLMSRSIRLVAAFDHRHVFIDPEPDPAVSFDERRRLAGLPGSSWADYDPVLISPGGGVWRRDAKRIPLEPAARRALGVEAEALSPPEAVSAILASPVDLLWFAGIGTFVKAPGESDLEVADHANDAVRITADQLRARVVAEGGNLGITQAARIRYSRRGGRINTDFIDNAAGVATSDREVNLKILLRLAVDEGRLDPAERDEYLRRSQEEVASEVLRQIDHSVSALNRAVIASAQELDAYAALIDALEGAGRFDRAVETLPSTGELKVRREAGAGLIRPELAVVLAYAKSDLVDAIERSPLVSDPVLLGAVVPYFPDPIRDAFADLIPRHRLYSQLVATDMSGELVDEMGIVWAHETAAELGRELSDVAAAFWAAREVLDAAELWNELERDASELSADAETALHATVREAVAMLARGYLVGSGHLDLEGVIARDRSLAELLGKRKPDKTAEDALVALGVPTELARRFVAAGSRAEVGEAGRVSRTVGWPVTDAATALAGVGRTVGLDRLTSAVSAALGSVPSPDRLTAWHGRALLDDVADWKRSASTEALGAAAEGGSASLAVEAWAEAHQADLARAEPLLAALDTPGVDPFAVAALVLRRLMPA